MASKREALIASAEKSLQKGKVDAALKDYLKVLEETPNDISVLNKVGDLFVRIGKADESIPYFLRTAEHYARDGFYVRGIAMYKKINKLDPARLEIYEKLAELYVKQQLWMEAKSNYQVLADYLLKQENLPGAIAIYEKMVGIEPQNLQLHVKLADLFTQAKKIPEALREYAIVAAALSERGAHEESIRVYEKALKLAPDNVDILKTLVPLLLSINSVEQARSVLRKGLEASPRSVPLFLLAAEAAFAANDMAEARSYSEKARAVEPENEDVLAAAVRIQLKGRRPDLAWTAAAPLADAAVRRGEAKKALALLVPIARAAPDNEELVRKIVDLAAGSGDEQTALPFRSALAELYRKKGKLAEAADLLRLCSRVQPDNAEFRARLTQLEAQSGVVSVAPMRVPPTSLEKKMEVTLSGFDRPARREPAPPPAPPAPAPEPEPPASGQEFEFDLEEVEAAEAPAPAPAPGAPSTPARGLVVPRPAAPPPPPADLPEPDWNSMSAAEALEAYEAREAERARAAAGRVEEIEELQPGAELPEVAPQPSGFPSPDSLELSLAPPEGFGPKRAPAATTFPRPAPGEAESPGFAWPSTPFGGLGSARGNEPGGPPSIGPLSGAVSPDAAIEESLTEADVYRRYGLLEKALEQIEPWVSKAPGNLKVREKVFEITLEQGNRDAARTHGTFLAEAYGAVGREDRIRGLEALLGEPLRAAPATEEPPVAEAAPPAAIAAIDESFPLAAGLVDVEPEPVPPVALLPSDYQVPADLSAGLGEPPASPELSLEEPGLKVDIPSLVPFAPVPEPIPGPRFEEPLPPLAEPDLSVEAALPTVAEPGTPVEAPRATLAEPEPVVEVPLVAHAPVMAAKPPAEAAPGPFAVPVAPSPASPPAPPKTRLSAEDVLGLGKPARPAAPKKAKVVQPEDLALDLLGARGKAKPKGAPPKAEPKAEPPLPDELLQTLKRPAPARPPEKAHPAPEIPELVGLGRPAPAAKAAVEEAGVEVVPTVVPAAPVAPAPVLLEPETLEPEAPAVVEPLLPEETPAAPGEVEAVFAPPVTQPPAEELAELDFCLDQGMVVDAAERLQTLEGRFPGDPELAARRVRLEGGRAGAETPRAALHDLLSDDLDSVLDAELGRALTEDMVRESPGAAPPPMPAPPAGAPVVDDSGLFSDEQEFFNFADELHTELRKEEVAPAEEGREVSLEEIFRDFKKGVEQQLSPEDYETHYNLGIAYKEMGLTDEAIGEFQLAAKDPLHAVECCAMLGLCFLEKGLPQLAVKWYRKGLDTIGIRDDDRLGLQYALAGILEQIGDHEGAYRTYLEIYGANAHYSDVAERIKVLRPLVAP